MNASVQPAPRFVGDLTDPVGRVIQPAGFLVPGATGPYGGSVGPSRSIYLTRGDGLASGYNSLSDERRALLQRMDRASSLEEFQAAETALQQSKLATGEIQRAEGSWDASQLAFHLGKTVSELQRGISSGQTGFPVRENLEAESKILVPVETPIRNKLPRIPGSGLSTLWRQTTSLGGGWGTSLDQPGGVAAKQFFFAETGSPDQTFASVYAAKSAPYKLSGVFGSVSGCKARHKTSRYIGEPLTSLPA